MKKTTKPYTCLYGWQKLDKNGRSEVAKLIAWLNEKSRIEKKFKDKPSAFLCRECSAKTGYTMKNYGIEPRRTFCELCDDPQSSIGLNSSWEKKKHWEGEGRR